MCKSQCKCIHLNVKIVCFPDGLTQLHDKKKFFSGQMLSMSLNFILPFKEGKRKKWNVSDYVLIKRVNEVCESC